MTRPFPLTNAAGETWASVAARRPQRDRRPPATVPWEAPAREPLWLYAARVTWAGVRSPAALILVLFPLFVTAVWAALEVLS